MTPSPPRAERPPSGGGIVPPAPVSPRPRVPSHHGPSQSHRASCATGRPAAQCTRPTTVHPTHHSAPDPPQGPRTPQGPLGSPGGARSMNPPGSQEPSCPPRWDGSNATQPPEQQADSVCVQVRLDHGSGAPATGASRAGAPSRGRATPWRKLPGNHLSASARWPARTGGLQRPFAWEQVKHLW